jgi:hypothetical protein
VSTNGLGVAVGIIGDPQSAQEDATLAENIYGFRHSDHLFNALIYMPSVESFKKFLILKEYFILWSDYLGAGNMIERPASVMAFTRQAIKRANNIMKTNVVFENFMRNISANNSHFSIGYHQDKESDTE